MASKSFGKLGKRLVVTSVICAIVIIAFVIISTISVRYSLNENIRGQRTLDQIDEKVNVLHDSLIDQETGQRGYSLTNEQSFLEPYYRGTENFELSLEELTQKTEIYPDLANEINNLIEKGQYWHTHYGEVFIELTKKGEEPTIEQLQAGKDALDEFRQLSETFIYAVEAERTVVRETMQTRVNITLIAVVLLTSAIIFFNLLMTLKVLKSITKPIIDLSDCVTAYAKNVFSKKIPEYNQENELTQLINNIDVMRKELSFSMNTLKSAINTDGLTGLFNRRFLDAFLQKEWEVARESGKSISIILFDIDFFKRFNDTYGHIKGDQCLQKIAACIHSYNQGSLNFTARYGGEEFAIVLINRTEQEVKAIAEDIQQKIEDLQIPHESSIVSRYVTVSIGVATVIPTVDMQVKDLIEMADKALYRSKHKGRNQVTFGAE